MESKDLPIVLKAFNIAKNPEYDGYQRGLVLMVYHAFLNKKVSGSGFKSDIIANLKNYTNQLLKFEKQKLYSSFKDNVWCADLADVQLISKFNTGIHFLLWPIYIYSKYAWIVPLRDKKYLTIINAFQKILNESNCKPNKMRVDRGS